MIPIRKAWRGWLGCGVLLALLAGGSAPAIADGKYYSGGRVPVGLPYQRALIVFDGQREILVVQSKYQSYDAAVPLSKLGWIVPVPAVPTVGTMSPEAAQKLFVRLFEKTRIEPLSLSLLLFNGVFIAAIGVLLVRLPLAALFPEAGRKHPFLLGTARGNWKAFAALVVSLVVLAIGIPQFSDHTKGSVKIHNETTVGGLDIKVVGADNASELLAWLTKHGFDYGNADIAAFEAYIAKRWVFVTASPATHADRADLIGERGMLAPLVLSFPTAKAIYPLALTATGGQETLIDLFVYHSGKMDAGGRLEMKYANEDENVSWIKEGIEPIDLLGREALTENFITRFRGKLTPEQMKDDLVLVRSANNASHAWQYTW